VLSLAAVLLELAQLAIPHRDANPVDVVVSAAGAVLGAALARLFMILWRRYLRGYP
jgi:VanZ family protein